MPSHPVYLSPEVFERLRAHAFTTHQPMGRLADSFITRELDRIADAQAQAATPPSDTAEPSDEEAERLARYNSWRVKNGFTPVTHIERVV